MRADNWKQLLKDKGWLQGSSIIAPNGYLLDMRFGKETINVSSDSSVTATNTFIIDETFKNVVGNGMRYYLWEDLTMVGIRPRDSR